LSIVDTDWAKVASIFMEFVQQEITVWKDFHQFWIRENIPIHIVRYEDIMQNPETVLKKAVEFILDVDDISGTKAGQYVKLAVEDSRPVNY